MQPVDGQPFEPPVPAAPLLKVLLKDVSRSFYLTLRVLPAPVRTQIGLAYLLARTTDTIADTTLVPLPKRLEALHLLRRRILGKSQTPLELALLAGQQSSAAERALVERVEETLALLNRLPQPDKEQLRTVLDTITKGQALDLQRFAQASADWIVALRNETELDDYTYRVAGCVGEFWTRMCRRHLFPAALVDEPFLLVNGVRFGKGLQLVNILRDLPVDLRQGRCYLPSDQLDALRLVPESLLEPDREPKFRPLYDKLLAQAEAHLAAGWDYTNALPRRCLRLRLACAWPVLIGVKTLTKLRTHPVLDPQQRVKISRAEVRGLIVRSVLSHPWPSLWRTLFFKAGAKPLRAHA